MSLNGVPMPAPGALSSFADHMLAHEHAVVKIREDMPLDRAALIGCAVTTGVGAVFRTAKVEPGSTVAVIGLGGTATVIGMMPTDMPFELSGPRSSAKSASRDVPCVPTVSAPTCRASSTSTCAACSSSIL